MYTVIGYPVTRTIRVLWALEELGLDYELNPVLPGSDETKEINPSGKVPILIEGDFKLTDSTAIMHYLADKHGGLLAKAGTQLRAQQDAMTFRLLDELDALLWMNARHTFVLPKEHRVSDIRPSAAWELNRNFDRLDADLTGPYLVGEQFGVADIILSHCVGWAKNVKIEITNKSILSHAKEMRARPAFQRLLPLFK
ncbi:glutathione S-transferase family protein [Epibacterium ulvae]|uniref:glutathione S-transferase family protein n=1 Tax=Epibacterium ulvae TaxID=1156985 RepID=UPI001BFC9A20|nr:glutathione S-transferase family protein [Epibacterium ulvae]MBT8153500.1 glutathione S-transferase family protein [Epibacterium ulvae]